MTTAVSLLDYVLFSFAAHHCHWITLLCFLFFPIFITQNELKNEIKLIFVLTASHIFPPRIIQFPIMLLAFTELEVFKIIT